MRILLADDHEIVRRGIRAILESQPGYEICGEATNGREAVEMSAKLRPDVVVLDITMPEMNGFTATRTILRDSPETQVLVLTSHDSEQVVFEVLDAGARGFVLKSDAGHDLLNAVESLRKGRPFLTTRASEIVLEGFLRGRSVRSTEDSRLTPRETEILQHLAEGKSNKEVASFLGISVKTAETHRGRIMAKLNLHSLSELVRYAVRAGLVEP